MAFSRNVEAQGIWIQRWMTGLVTQRSPLFTPITNTGLQFVNRLDALIDGLNMEISPIMTLVRRPAYTRFSSVAFGTGDYPLNFYSFQNTSGTIYPLVDTPNKVYNFSSTTNTPILTKGGGAGRGDFLRVGDYVYYCNGVDTKFWDGTTWSNWGIVAPAAAPTFTTASGSLSPLSGYTYVVCYVNTVTGHVSAASPLSASTGAQTSKKFTVSYTASTDPQVNQIWIFRTQDGGGVFYFLAAVTNATSTYSDNNADSVLNTLIVAPFAPNNAPCPAGSSLVTYWDGRPWVAAKNFLYWAMGPQATTGVGEQAFNLTTNFFKLPGNINGYAPTSQGLLIFTSDTTWIVTGTGGVYFINPWQKNFGVKQPNAVAQDGDSVFVVTSRGQAFEIASGSLTEIGFNIRAKIAAMNPKTVSIVIHRNGTDEGIFLSDNATNVYRFSQAFQCWCPAGVPQQGAGVVKSIETTDSIWTLLLGGTAGAGFIGGRNLTSWTDDGGTYTCSATVGSLIIGPPGSKNNIEALTINATRTGTYPTVSILTNEISGPFATLPNPVAEPPNLRGESLTLYTRRHYLKSGCYPNQAPIPQQIEHCQIKVSFLNENFQGELLGLGVI